MSNLVSTFIIFLNFAHSFIGNILNLVSYKRHEFEYLGDIRLGMLGQGPPKENLDKKSSD